VRLWGCHDATFIACVMNTRRRAVCSAAPRPDGKPA
jgi:hypothetical protein